MFAVLVNIFFAILVYYEYLPEAIYAYNIALSNSISYFAGVNQIYEIYLKKSYGNMSFIPNFVGFLGCSGRIYTVFMSNCDLVVISILFVHAILCAIICIQFGLYKGNKLIKTSLNKIE